MNNNFLRGIFSSEDTEVITLVYKSLSNEGLEVYIKKNNEYVLASAENYISEDNNLYIPAADCQHAAKLISDLGYTDFIMDYSKGNDVKSEVEIAEEKFYKKRKLMYIEAAVIIAIGIIYYLLKA